MVRSHHEIHWALFTCTITHVFVHVFTFMHMALMPVLMEEFSLSIFESGLLVSIPLVLSVSVSIPYGVLTDRIEPKQLMVASLLLSGFSGLAVSQARDPNTLLVALVLVSLSSTLYHPPVLSIVSELFPQSWRNRAFGIHGAGGTSGVAIGPITLGLVMERFGWRFAYLVWTLPIFVSTLFLVKLPKLSKMADDDLGQKVDLELPIESGYSRTLIYGYVMLLLAMSIKGVGDQGISTYMTTYLVSSRGLSGSIASIIYGLNSLVGILGSLSGGYLADYVGSRRWMILAYLASAVVLAGIYLGPIWLLIAFYLIGGYFGGSTMAPSSSLVADFSPRERRGFAYAVFMLPFSFVGAISPIIAAEIIESYNISALFPFAIFVSSVSALFLQLIAETPKRKPDRRHRLSRD